MNQKRLARDVESLVESGVVVGITPPVTPILEKGTKKMSNPEVKTLAQRLLAFQTEVGAVAKDSDNPFFKSKYFDINKLLEVAKPVLSKHGILVLQPLTNLVIEGKAVPALTTLLINADNMTDQLVSTIPLPEVTDVQKFGGAITYFRRYTLVAVLGLQAEDDDGNSLVSPPPSRKPVGKKVFGNAR